MTDPYVPHDGCTIPDGNLVEMMELLESYPLGMVLAVAGVRYEKRPHDDETYRRLGSTAEECASWAPWHDDGGRAYGPLWLAEEILCHGHADLQYGKADDVIGLP